MTIDGTTRNKILSAFRNSVSANRSVNRSLAATSSRFSVAKSTIKRWRSSLRKTGTVYPRKKRKTSKFIVAENHLRYLEYYLEHFEPQLLAGEMVEVVFEEYGKTYKDADLLMVSSEMEFWICFS